MSSLQWHATKTFSGKKSGKEETLDTFERDRGESWSGRARWGQVCQFIASPPSFGISKLQVLENRNSGEEAVKTSKSKMASLLKMDRDSPCICMHGPSDNAYRSLLIVCSLSVVLHLLHVVFRVTFVVCRSCIVFCPNLE